MPNDQNFPIHRYDRHDRQNPAERKSRRGLTWSAGGWPVPSDLQGFQGTVPFPPFPLRSPKIVTVCTLGAVTKQVVRFRKRFRKQDELSIPSKARRTGMSILQSGHVVLLRLLMIGLAGDPPALRLVRR